MYTSLSYLPFVCSRQWQPSRAHLCRSLCGARWPWLPLASTPITRKEHHYMTFTLKQIVSVLQLFVMVSTYNQTLINNFGSQECVHYAKISIENPMKTIHKHIYKNWFHYNCCPVRPDFTVMKYYGVCTCWHIFYRTLWTLK